MSVSPMGIAVVTGASSGIGAVYADRLARRGYDLILIARDAKRLDDVAKCVSTATTRNIQTIPADLGNKRELGDIEAFLDAQQGITMLVNSAGKGALEPLLSSDIEDMEAMIWLNAAALTRLIHVLMPQFVGAREGAIINIASALAIAPEFLNGVYCATKAYVLALSQSLRKELAPYNIRVQAVLPGATATRFWKAAGASIDSVPEQMMMLADDLVDAALAGFDRGENVTIPSLPDEMDWQIFEAARQNLFPNLSLRSPADRYRTDDSEWLTSRWTIPVHCSGALAVEEISRS